MGSAPSSQEDAKYTERKTYNKLVRDRILEILDAQGKPYGHHVADHEEYSRKLWDKLDEEVTELKNDPNATELADVLEVLYAIAHELGINPEQLESVRQQRADKRGAFKDRIILEWS